jgi:hypothetical protein
VTAERREDSGNAEKAEPRRFKIKTSLFRGFRSFAFGDQVFGLWIVIESQGRDPHAMRRAAKEQIRSGALRLSAAELPSSLPGWR